MMRVRVIEQGDFNLGEVALLTAKRLGCDIRCHMCSHPVEWRNASVEQIGTRQWRCVCVECETGTHEFENESSAAGLSPMKAMKAMKAKKAIKAKKAMKAMKVKD